MTRARLVAGAALLLGRTTPMRTASVTRALIVAGAALLLGRTTPMRTASVMRALLVTGAALLLGCTTLTPMQTASVVDVHTARIGGQFSTAGFCGNAGEGGLGLTRCAEYPDGVPLPELRVNGRIGVARGLDVGASVQGTGQIFAPERAVQLGVTLDVKKELLRLKTSGPTHIFSAGLLFGAASAFRFGLPAWGQTEWGVPLLYGLQVEHFEVVLSSTIVLREVTAPPPGPITLRPRVSFSLGLFRRNPAGFAVQVSYLTDPNQFLNGAIQLQIGVFWDVIFDR